MCAPDEAIRTMLSASGGAWFYICIFIQLEPYLGNLTCEEMIPSNAILLVYCLPKAFWIFAKVNESISNQSEIAETNVSVRLKHVLVFSILDLRALIKPHFQGVLLECIH